MELPGFLKLHVDPGVRDEVPDVNSSASLVTDEEVAKIMRRGRSNPIEKFTRSLEDMNEYVKTQLRTQFFRENFLRLWPEARAS
jgi:hypothetical protein